MTAFKVLIAITLCAVLLFILSFRADTARAKETYRSHFDTPLDRIKGLRVSGVGGIGRIAPGYQHFLRFAYDGEARLQINSRFTSGCDPNAIAEEFLKQFPDDRLALVDKENLICRWRMERFNPVNSLTEYYLVNTRTRVHFFNSNYVD